MLYRWRSALIAALSVAAFAADRLPLDHPDVDYAAGPLTDPVAQLSRAIEQGKARLDYDPVTGYLPSVLKALNIPVESQMAVFSKTSIQAMRIDPANPRVLYFNDSVVAGWVRGGFVEFASQDPKRGMIFYRLDQRLSAYKARLAAEKSGATSESPFTRRQDCLNCHDTVTTLGVPGVLLKSVRPDIAGVPLPHMPQYDTDSRMLFGKLWGGWYVTGKTGDAEHMGNRLAGDARVSLENCAPNTRLTPYSDIAALLVFEHQVRVMNLLTRAGWESRMALPGARAALDELADALLFTDEAPLKGAIESTSGFAEVFSAQGPKDRHGRSLYELSLKGRLMKYPCSYMIYSPAFAALPDDAKAAVYRRIKEVLSKRDESDRKAILEILADTCAGRSSACAGL
jgi:hypothetical protein